MRAAGTTMRAAGTTVTATPTGIAVRATVYLPEEMSQSGIYIYSKIAQLIGSFRSKAALQVFFNDKDFKKYIFIIIKTIKF